jgi:hypothetical protein
MTSQRARERAERRRTFHTQRLAAATTEEQKANAAWELWRATVADLPEDQARAERARMADHLSATAGQIRKENR